MTYNFNFPATFNLKDLNGTNGFSIVQDESPKACNVNLGVSLNLDGDANGDGIKDLVAAADSNGDSVMLLGQKLHSFPSTIPYSKLSSFGGTTLQSYSYSFGSPQPIYSQQFSSLSSTIFLPDGKNDDHDGKTPAAAVVYFGHQGPFHSVIDFSNLSTGQGFQILGSNGPAQPGGPSVISGGFVADVNGDSIPENALIYSNGNNWWQCLLFGTLQQPSTNFIATAIDGTNGICVLLFRTFQGFDYAHLQSFGDFDGNGFGEFGYPSGPNKSGAIDSSYQNSVYIFKGAASYPSGFMAFSNMPSSMYYEIVGLPGFGFDTIASAGDLDGNGLPDIAIASSLCSLLADDDAPCKSAQGQIHIILGKKGGIVSPFSVSNLNGQNGFTIVGPNLGGQGGFNIGFAMASLKDIDGNGADELLFSLPGTSQSPGQVFCLMGSNGGFPAVINYADMPGRYGFVINGINAGDMIGFSLSTGDFDGNGVADIAIGAPIVNYPAGAVYVVYMPASPPKPATPVGDSIYANLALEVYNNPSDSSILPPGRLPTSPDGTPWQVLYDCGGTQNPGFYSKFYSDGGNLVIAVRGTVVTIGSNVVQDLIYVLPGQIPTYFDDLITCANNATATFPNLKLSFTGHSLGAYLAQLGGIKYNAPTVTFEAPGTSHAVETAIAAGDPRFAGVASPNWQNIKTFQAAPDLITMAGGEHKETVVRLFPSFDPSAPIYTLQQHSMANLYKQFNLNTGYAHNNASMTGYWDIDGTPKNWPFPNQFTSDPVALNSLLNSAFFSNYDQNPYYLDLLNNASPQNGFTPSTNYAGGGITITADNSGSTLFGGTNFADTMTGGTGDDTFFPFGGNNVITDPSGNDVYVFSPYNMGGVSSITDLDGYGSLAYYHSYSTPFSSAKICFVNSPMPITQSYFSSNTKVYAYFPALDGNCPDHNSGYTFLLTQNGVNLEFSNANEKFNNNTWVVNNFHNGNLGITLSNSTSKAVIVGTSGDDTMVATAGAIVAGLGGHNLIFMPQDGSATVIKDPNGFDVYKPQAASNLGASLATSQFFGVGMGQHVLDYSSLGLLPTETLVSIYKTPYTITLLSNGTYVNETLIRTDVLISAPGTQLLLNATDFVISTYDQANFYYLNATAETTMNLLDAPGVNATQIIAAFNQTVNPSPSPTPSPEGPGEGPHHSDIGLIAGAAVGGVVGLALLGFGGYYLHNKGFCGSANHEPPADTYNPIV